MSASQECCVATYRQIKPGATQVHGFAKGLLVLRRLTALQTQQQLASQSLSIANGSQKSVLQLLQQ